MNSVAMSDVSDRLCRSGSVKRETKPRNKNHRKVRYNGIVYNSATELSQLMGVTPACIRRKCALKLHDFEYV